eukprot:TRINITY_DN28278_c0_g1_i1.p1 TRINITY_DN28278_c0_g1~~TRINITY_DN28278_c0_g1_i1.p1  ORF type:complete len:702 (+),score=120.81 TRINITY_DN28278_c0_g1_i1:128-2233(+)
MDFEQVSGDELIDEYRHHYLDYKSLSNILEEGQTQSLNFDKFTSDDLAQSQSGRGPSALFMKAVDAQLEKMNLITANKSNELQLALANLSRSTFEAGARSRTGEMTRLADNLARRIVDFDAFVKQNESGFVQIIDKHDELTGLSVKPWFSQRLKREPFTTVSVSGFIVTLSDIYSRIRTLKDSDNTEAGTWKPPTSFERDTTKYWVKPTDVVRIKTHIIKHLPVLIFDRETGKATTTPEISRLKDAADITSVYMDNEDLDCYHTRSERLEGATLTRFRWYGNEMREVFVERKTHHESWVKESSVKERFNLKPKKIMDFMLGNLDINAEAAKMRKKGASESAIEKMIELATEVSADIQERGLEPKVRTVYKRTAFQLPSDNAVRISMDTNLCMIRESYNPQEKRWCRGGSEELLPQDVERFPYAILEIKLQDASPPWIEGLMQLCEIREVHKFSKFLHGISTFYPHKTRVEPQWLQYMRSARREVRNIVPMGVGQRAPLLAPPETPLLEQRLVDQRSNPTTASAPRLSPQMPSGLSERRTQPEPASAGIQQRRPPPPPPQSVAAAPAPASAPPPTNKGPPVPKRIGKQVKVEPKTFFANERTLLQWLNTVVLLGLACISLIALGKDNIVAFAAGVMLAAVAVIFAFYSLYTYQQRLNAMMSGEAIRYDDRIGPPILVVSLVLVLGVSVIFGLANRDPNSQST